MIFNPIFQQVVTNRYYTHEVPLKQEVFLLGFLYDTIGKIDKKGLLKLNLPLIGYPTQLFPLDFRNGYTVLVHDDDGNIVERWANIGLFGGTIITVAGKPGTAKTAFCTQVAAEICRSFEMGEIHLFDIEGSSNISRIMELIDYNYDDVKDKFIYHDEIDYVEDMFEFINNMAKIKLDNRDKFIVDFNHKDEFGKIRQALAPTVIIIDSLPQLMTKDLEGLEGMAGQTYDMRKARVLSQFYTRIRPVVKKANIIVLIINHINTKADISQFAKSQAQIMYMKQDEAMPGGNKPQYLSQTLLKFVSCGKYTLEDDGFNGFAIRVELIKSKTNRAGTSCVLVYDAKFGFDKYRTIFKMLKDEGYIEGRNPYLYIKGFPEIKFSSKNFRNACKENVDLFKLAVKVLAPTLYSYLGSSDDLDSYNETPEEIAARMNKSDD